MGKLVRMLSEDGSVMACALDSTDIAAEIEHIHEPSAVVTAALGRLATTASMIGFSLKGKDDTVTLRIDGGGPAGRLIAVADSSGNVKACADQTIVEIPLNAAGKLDVKGAVGTNGYLSVIKDFGLKEPYIGQTPLVSGEIAEDITNYYAVSEQIPTVCGLGVLVNPDLTVRAAGGFLVQLLPFADESCIDVLEANLKTLPPVSAMFEQGYPPQKICEFLLAGLNPNLLEEANTTYRCDCSEARAERTVRSLPVEDLQEMLDEDGGCEICCHFCGAKYRISKKQLAAMIHKKKQAARQTADELSGKKQ